MIEYIQNFQNNYLYVSNNTSFYITESNCIRAKILLNNKKYFVICFIWNNQIVCYLNNTIYELSQFKILKIFNIINLYDGSQIKFKLNNKIVAGYIHYFDINAVINQNKILIIDYYDYEKTYLIDINRIIANDFTII